MICKNCQKELPEGVKFCSGCGTPVVAEPAPAEPVVEEVIVSEAPVVVEEPVIEAPVAVEEPVVTETPAEVEAPASPEAPAAPKAPKKKLDKKILLFAGLGVIAAAIVALIIVLVSSLSGGSKGNGETFDPLYIKDGELYYSEFSKDEPVELTSRLAQDLQDNEYSYLGYNVANFVAMNEKGTRLFYPDKMGDSDGAPLFYRDLNKKNAEAVKVDSDITAYAINPAGTKILYLKGDDGNLYISDLEEKEKIASDVEDFYTTEDLKKVCYVKEDNLYVWQEDGDSTKLATDIAYVAYTNEELSVVGYFKDDVLYMHDVATDEKEKISSDVYTLARAYESGELYYLEETTTEIKLMDYVDDDMAAADAAYEEPVYPEYPTYPYWWNYDTDAEYEAALAEYETAYAEYLEKEEAYYAALDEYYNVSWRNDLRAYLQEYTMELTQYDLYYYNGTESVKVCENVAGPYEYGGSYDIPLLYVNISEKAAVEKVKLSEMTYYDEVYYYVEDAITAGSVPQLVSGAQISEIDAEPVTSVRFNEDGTKIWFRTNVSDKDEGDLYVANIKNGQVTNKELVDTDVSFRTQVVNGSDLVYFKDLNTEKYTGDLYLNGEEVTYDVYYYNITGHDGSILYFSDWDEEDSCGTLCSYKNGKTEEVGDEVYRYTFNADGDILYLNDYSSKRYTGTLYLYEGGESVKIDEDVQSLVNVYNRGIYYIG